MKKILYCTLVLCALLVLVYWCCPKPEITNATYFSRVLLDEQGNLLRLTLSEDDRYRLYQPIDSVSDQMQMATILYEDRNYYQHFGVDIPALIRAAWTTYAGGSRRVGASTLAMQVARMRWKIRSHTASGKIHQIARALQLSRHFSKQEILEAYFNLAPFGRNIEGIGAASLIYFNKQPDQLSLPEVLTLAVIPQNPNKRNPTTAQGYSSLLKARENLFNHWIQKYPNDMNKKAFIDMPMNVRAQEALPFIAPHFVNYILNKLSRWEHGYIQTTLNSRIQKRIEGVVSRYISSNKNIGIRNASVLLVKHDTMEIQAMIGSADFQNKEIQGQVNGVLAKRSPGSTLKPFVYALAMDEGLIHPMSLLKDSPKRFGGFTPENYDKQFLGPILAKRALIESRNVPAVDLQSQLTTQSFYDFLKRAGVSKLKEESFYGLALALGGGELTMLELITLYGALTNHGLVKSVRGMKQDIADNGERVLSPEASFLTLSMLSENPAPGDLGSSFQTPYRNDVAWKTGTSWGFRDAWAIGVSGPYIVAVWVGNFNGQGNDAFVGRSAAGPLLFSIFDSIFPDQGWKVHDLVSLNDLNIKKVKVCAKTGDLANRFCPSFAQTWFIPGVSPIKVSNIYREIAIDVSTGLRACGFQTEHIKKEVFEFWPSDFLHIFNLAGISLKTPPSFSEKCSLDQKSTTGQTPVITSPQVSVDYVISGDRDSTLIPFTAVVDPDVEKLYWFVDGRYVGASNQGKPYLWQAKSGSYQVRAVDDAGRAATKTIKVLQLN